MTRIKKILSSVLVMLMTMLSLFSNIPAQAAKKPVVVPQVQFANAPVTEYKVGDRVGFNIYSPNYGGRVEYRVVLWNDSKKSYSDLWDASNGYPTRYYTKWQPYGNNIFTLGWIINEPGSYRITVYAKRVGIPNSKGALKAYNCDSFMESVAFRVKPKVATVESILPVSDVTVNQYGTPALPSTVKAKMSDGTEKNLKVTWGTTDTTKSGTFIILGTVEGTTLNASVRLIVNPVSTYLNVYSVEARTINLINVNLRESIGFTPDLSRFSLSGYVNGYGISNIRLYSAYMSTDRKTIQLSTDTLTLGSWYTLKIDGKEYTFQVPYNIGTGNGSTISLTARNMTVNIGTPLYPDVTVYPSDAVLSYTSYNSSIAKYNQYTGRIEGISPGVATFSVTATRTGYETKYETFSVTVRGYSYYLEAEPDVLHESSANDGSLVSGLITVTSPYENFRTDLNKNYVTVNNLPNGFNYAVERYNNKTLKIYITGKATNHTDDREIYVTVYNGVNSEREYLISNEILIDFCNTTVTGIKPISDITAPLGTAKADLGLPTKAVLKLSDGTEKEVSVTAWDNGTPAYNANLTGVYEFKGTVALPSGVSNPDNYKAKVKVVLGSQNVGVVAEDFGVFDGEEVKGYNVGFKLVGATASGVERIVVNLFKDTDLLATNTSDGVLEEYPGAYSLSAPFDVFGTFDYEEDGNWSYSGWLGSKQDIPTKAVIIVTFKNGVTKTAQNTNLTGDTSIFKRGGVGAAGLIPANNDAYNGYCVEFELKDAKASDVKSIEIDLYKGNKHLAKITSRGVMENYPNATILSAPFDLSGRFKYEADGNWTYSGWKGYYSDVPTKAVIRVVFKNGIEKTVDNIPLTIE